MAEEKLELWRRNPVECIKELFGNPVTQNLFLNILRPSPSVSVCSRPFSALYSVPSYYSVYLCPLLLHLCPYCVSVLSVSSFQLSTLGSDPFLVSSDLAFILLPLLFGYNPYQPNPIAPRFLIVFCPLLSYDLCVLIVPICINYDKLQQFSFSL